MSTKVLFLKAGSIPENARWITLHPNGPGTTGQAVLIQPNADGSAHVIGGAGGKLQFLKLRGVRKESEYKKEAEDRKKAKAEDKEAAGAVERGVKFPYDPMIKLPATAQPANAAAPIPPRPKLGEKRDGWTYRGGDPAKPESWAK